MATRDQGSGINMGDPSVRRLLGVDERVVTGKPGRELVQVAGDQDRGISSTVRADRSAIAHPLYWYKGVGIGVADVYKLPNEPLYIHIICPKCHHALTISQTRKAIDFEVGQHVHKPTDQDLARVDNTASSASSPPMQHALQSFGKLSVETFECTWEMGKDRQQFGVSLCKFRAAIDNNVIKEA